jgi:hypothetical protein
MIGVSRRQLRQVWRSRSTDSTTPSGTGIRTNPITLAYDRRFVDVLVEKKDNLIAWAKTILPVTHKISHDARA